MKTGKDSVVQASTILFILNMLASALNYLCQILLAKVLSVDSFGTINTIFSFLLVIGVPGATLTMIVAKYYAEENGNAGNRDKSNFIGFVLRDVSVLAVFIFVVLILLSPVLGSVLMIDNQMVLLYAFVLGALSLYQPIYSGFFSGNKKFVLVGIYSLFIPLYKIAAVISARITSDIDLQRLYMVLLIMVAGNVVTILYGHIKSANYIGKIHVFIRGRSDWMKENDIVYTLILNVGLMLYMNIDLFAVRYIGSSTDSGLYSAVLLFGRIIYYFSTTLGTILLPVAASQKEDGSKNLKLLNKTLLCMLGFALAVLLPINLLGKQILGLLYGNEYVVAYSYIKYTSLISVALSLATILANYLVGVGKVKIAAGIMVVGNIVIAILMTISTQLEAVLLGIGLIGFAGAAVTYFASVRVIKEKEYV